MSDRLHRNAHFTIERSLPHGHVGALLAMTRRLGLDRLIAPQRSPERDRVLAMVVERLLHPASKLATLQWVHWYNHRRLFGPLGQVPPAAFEAHYYHQLPESAMVA